MLSQQYRYLQLFVKWSIKIAKNMIDHGCHVEILKGQEKITRQELIVLYIGSYRNYRFLINHLFSGEYVLQKRKRTHPLFVLVSLKSLLSQMDILIIDLDLPYNYLFSHLKVFHIPPWVKQHLPLPATTDAQLTFLPRKTRKEAQRWARKFSFSHSITTDQENFDKFYHYFYTPYIKTRHGDVSEVVDLEFFLSEAKGGFLFWLNYHDKPVGAALLKEEGKALRFVWVGFADRGFGVELKGTSDVLDYFTIQYACKHGFKRVDFGSTRPLANDGVFRYKQKWGAVASLGKVPSGAILIKPLQSKLAVQSFFSSNLWITREHKRISILYMLNHENMNIDQLKSYQKFVSKGISCLHFITTDQIDMSSLSDEHYKITLLPGMQD